MQLSRIRAAMAQAICSIFVITILKICPLAQSHLSILQKSTSWTTSYDTLITTFPTCFPAARYLYASGASLKGKTLSMIGSTLTLFVSRKALTASRSALDPPRIPLEGALVEHSKIHRYITDDLLDFACLQDQSEENLWGPICREAAQKSHKSDAARPTNHLQVIRNGA
jgi:hypothetical protein